MTFFDCRGIILKHWLPHRQTITAAYYIEVLETLWRAIARKQPELWANNSWLLHHNNAPAHLAIATWQFLAKMSTTGVGTLCLFSRFSTEWLRFVSEDERSLQGSAFSVRGSHESGARGGRGQPGRNGLPGVLPDMEIESGEVHLSGRRVHWRMPSMIVSTL